MTPRRLVAVGQFGRSVKDAARRLGIALPPCFEAAPGDPVPAAGAVIVLDADLVGPGDLDGRPALVVAASRSGSPAGLADAEIALRRGPDAPEGAAVLLGALLEAEAPDLGAAYRASVHRLALEPDRPRRDCAHLLAARTAQRLLAEDGVSAPAAQAAWSPLLRAIAGEAPPVPARFASLFRVQETFAAGAIRARDLPGAVRDALAAVLDSPPPAISLATLAADLDRALGLAVVAGGLAAGRALLSESLRVATAARGGVPGGDDPDAAARLADALADLERRARSWELVVTLTRRSALLAGLQEVAEAAAAALLGHGEAPPAEPTVALLESRWARLDEVEDQLGALAEAAGTAARNIRAEDYLASLPGGEEAAAAELLHDLGIGPALLSGDLPAFLEARAARFFTWVPDAPLEAQIADLPAEPARAFAGIPGRLAAGAALDLAGRLADTAVPLDLDGQILLVRLEPAAAGAAMPQAPGPDDPAAGAQARLDEARLGRQPGADMRPCAPVALPHPGPHGEASEGSDADRLLVGTVAYQDEPTAALAAAWDAAPCFRHEAGFLDALAELQGSEEEWSARSRSGVGRFADEPGEALDLAWIAAFLWEDRLPVWDGISATLREADRLVLAFIPGPRPPDVDLPVWYEATVPEPVDPIADSADMAAIALATHLVTHVGGYLAYAYREDNGLIHAAYLAPADDPGALVAGLLEHREVLPYLRRDAQARLADSRYHEAIRSFTHDLGAEVATRDWLRMPVSDHQRLMAERGFALVARLPAPGREVAAGVAPPLADVAWDAGVILPGLGQGAA
ncbi:MAG: hypothetical protein FJZ01_08905 [Candidatus Sericytochromatia bacterium]|nr:hypothetical protein [Candidatus Tanganyikabacteria bacterium]